MVGAISNGWRGFLQSLREKPNWEGVWPYLASMVCVCVCVCAQHPLSGMYHTSASEGRPEVLSRWRRPKGEEGCHEVSVRENSDELTLGAEEVGTCQSCINVDHFAKGT